MKPPNPPSTVTIAILTTITIVFWIFYSVYQILSSSPSTDIPPQVLAPLEPTLDAQTLNQLSSKIYFEKNEFAQLPEFVSLSPTKDLVNPTETISESEEAVEEGEGDGNAEEENPEEIPAF